MTSMFWLVSYLSWERGGWRTQVPNPGWLWSGLGGAAVLGWPSRG